MSYQVNPSSRSFILLDGVTGGENTSAYVYRGSYINHQIQISTAGATAQNFTLYTSNDATVWTAIRNETDVDNTVTGYTGATASGVIQLSGCYPWLKIVSGTASTASPFTATLYSTNRID